MRKERRDLWVAFFKRQKKLLSLIPPKTSGVDGKEKFCHFLKTVYVCKEK